MGEGNTKKKSGLTRKHFIIGLLAVCAIAVIAEAVLLIHTFSKKKKEAKAPDKKIEGNAGTETEKEPTATPDSEEGNNFRTEWKLISRRQSDNGAENSFVYDYDEYGRQTRIAYLSQGKTVWTDYYSYTKNGYVFEEWIPDKRGEKNHTAISDQIGALETIWDSLTDGIAGNYEEAFDRNGNRIKLTITLPGDGEKYPEYTAVQYLYEYEYDEKGRLTKRTKSEGIDGEFKLRSFDELVYDSEGRLKEHTYYCDTQDSGRCLKVFCEEHTYEIERTIVRTVHYTEAGGEDWTEIYTDWQGNGINEFRSETKEYANVNRSYVPSSLEFVQISSMAMFIGELYTNTVTRKDGTVEEIRRAEFDEEGRPVAFYDAGKSGPLANCEYDEQGRLKKAVLYGMMGGDVQYDFEYDEAGNLIRLDYWYIQMEYRGSWYLEWAELSVLAE